MLFLTLTETLKSKNIKTNYIKFGFIKFLWFLIKFDFIKSLYNFCLVFIHVYLLTVYATKGETKNSMT